MGRLKYTIGEGWDIPIGEGWDTPFGAGWDIPLGAGWNIPYWEDWKISMGWLKNTFNLGWLKYTIYWEDWKISVGRLKYTFIWRKLFNTKKLVVVVDNPHWNGWNIPYENFYKLKTCNGQSMILRERSINLIKLAWGGGAWITMIMIWIEY